MLPYNALIVTLNVLLIRVMEFVCEPRFIKRFCHIIAEKAYWIFLLMLSWGHFIHFLPKRNISADKNQLLS